MTINVRFLTINKNMAKVSFKDKIKNLIKKINNEFYPRGYKCVVCGEELSTNTLYSICDKCMESLPFNNGKTCVKCSEPIGNMSSYCIHCKNEKPHYKKNVSVFLYKEPVDNFIRGLKYDNKKYLAETLSNFIAGEVSKMAVNFDYVVPVPVHADRLKKRGYNQSELLCISLKNKLNLNVDTTILTKSRFTRSQANLTRSERIENLKDSFKVTDKSKIKGKIVLLVDDVFTTGTTINECAKTLLEAGAKEVYSVTLAHANTKVIYN